MNRRRRLGEVLVEACLISPEQLDRVLAIQRHEQKPLGRILVEQGWIEEKDIYKALSEIWGIEYVDISQVMISPQVLQIVPEEIAKKYLVFPLFLQDKLLYLAMENPLQLEPIQLIEFKTRLRVKPLLASRSKIQEALNRHFNMDNYVEKILAQVQFKEKIQVIQNPEEEEDLSKLEKSTEGSQVLQLVNLILVNAIKKRTSDIHIEPAESLVGIRYRIDGLLSDPIRLPKPFQQPLISRIKVMANLDIAEKRRPQDGKIKIHFSGRPIDLRVSTLPTNFGEKVVIRILDKKAALHNLASLGMSEAQLTIFQQALSQPQGLILVTGPTGSGKTTTLYAGLNALRDKTRNIVTIEDPIEYQLEGINQVQVNRKAGVTFASVLRSVLRQDPNVILVGEIRDSETAEIAIQASQTGHLVLSTLHTNDAVATVTRLLNLGIAPDQVASNLILAMAQRLIRRICLVCKKSYVPSSEELKKFGLGKPSAMSFSTLYRGTGCEQCRNIGYYGQAGIFEMLVPGNDLKLAISNKTSETVLKKLAIEQGMVTLWQDGLSKVRQGVTTLDEMARVCYIQESLTGESSGLRELCRTCQKELDPNWKLCPYCGTPKLPESPGGSQRVYKILVADDDDRIGETLEAILEDRGYQILRASNGVETLDKVQKENPDLVLLDIGMPLKTGFEVCKELRASVETMFIPIIMLTAQTSISEKLKGLSLGADDYITKPFNGEELVERIKAVLRRSYHTL
jgi:type IV pilus assembly protein PilB